MGSKPQVPLAETTLPQRNSKIVSNLPFSGERTRLYRGVLVALILWFVGYVYLLAEVVPTAIYWLSYYAVDYTAGFVRRGLGGQLIALFPDQYYFPISYILMWGSFAVYCGALILLAWHILSRGTKSERRLMVSLLIPVLPFTITFAIFGPRPELYAAGALILFGIALTRLARCSATIVASAIFGTIIAVLAFIHELIPVQFAFGAVLAISVLAPPVTTGVRWLCMTLSAGPGLLATSVIVFFGRRNVNAQLCDAVPPQLLTNPFQVPPDKLTDYVMGRYQSVSDYHDWVCHNIVPYFDASVSDWMRSVIALGAVSLIAGFLHGLLVCIGTLWLIQYFTAVRWNDFVSRIRGGVTVPLLALALMIPVFATGVDWIRWWAIILINVATIYLIFAALQPGIEKPVTTRQSKVFVAVVILLACLPVLAGPGYFSGWVTV